MAKKAHGRRPMVKPRQPKKPARENNRHHAQQSAVLEFCICGEPMDDPIHIRKRIPKPVPRPMVQIGITPDIPETRMHVKDLLHWNFVERIDEGVWNVETLRPWPVNVGLDATITLPDGEEISINLEWP